MSTYTQILYHVVFATKNRELTLEQKNRDELFKYIAGLIKNKNCHTYSINGVEDHLHILTHLHPSVPLATLVKDIKIASTLYIKEKKLFNRFCGWQAGYGAFTYSTKDKRNVINYIENQEEHHKTVSFFEEYKNLLNEHEIVFDEKYLL